jgi:glucose/arabinose dehydrogenase
LFFTIGDRGNRDENPQDITRDCGKVYRINDDGTIPDDNPFYKVSNAKKAIYSYGHRNPQGMTLHPKTNEQFGHTNMAQKVVTKLISLKQVRTMGGP